MYCHLGFVVLYMQHRHGRVRITLIPPQIIIAFLKTFPLFKIIVDLKQLRVNYVSYMTSLVAQTVKRLSTMQETWFPSLGGEDLLQKEMATHSSILAWKIPCIIYVLSKL